MVSPFETKFYIVEEYFGKFNSKRVICESYDVGSLCLIVDLLVEHFENRPFMFKIKWIGPEPDLDSHPWTGARDFSEYFNGIYCI